MAYNKLPRLKKAYRDFYGTFLQTWGKGQTPWITPWLPWSRIFPKPSYIPFTSLYILFVYCLSIVLPLAFCSLPLHFFGHPHDCSFLPIISFSFAPFALYLLPITYCLSLCLWPSYTSFSFFPFCPFNYCLSLCPGILPIHTITRSYLHLLAETTRVKACTKALGF